MGYRPEVFLCMNYIFRKINIKLTYTLSTCWENDKKRYNKPNEATMYSEVLEIPVHKLWRKKKNFRSHLRSYILHYYIIIAIFYGIVFTTTILLIFVRTRLYTVI